MHNASINSLNCNVLLFNDVTTVEDNPISFNVLPWNIYFYKYLLPSETACLHTLKSGNIVNSSRNFIIKQWTHGQFSAINVMMGVRQSWRSNIMTRWYTQGSWGVSWRCLHTSMCLMKSFCISHIKWKGEGGDQTENDNQTRILSHVIASGLHNLLQKDCR